MKFLFKSKNKLKSLKVLFLIIYFLVRHLGEKSILCVFSLTCWGLTGSQHISTTLTILRYLDLKVAAWITCFRCTYFEIMLEGFGSSCPLNKSPLPKAHFPNAHKKMPPSQMPSKTKCPPDLMPTSKSPPKPNAHLI